MISWHLLRLAGLLLVVPLYRCDGACLKEVNRSLIDSSAMPWMMGDHGCQIRITFHTTNHSTSNHQQSTMRVRRNHGQAASSFVHGGAVSPMSLFHAAVDSGVDSGVEVWYG